MKHWINLLVFTSVTMNVSAQGKSLMPEDLLPGGKTYTQFIPKTEYQIQWMGDKLIFADKTTRYIVNPFKPSETDFCSENRQTAFTKENNLYITDAVGQTIPAAEDSNKHIIYGQAVHRNEFGIRKGTLKAADGTTDTRYFDNF